ncbi:unnamed protein product [Aureobasidium pullulans]|nr:unnamed protein product [Aureobasidium pullulans]CAD0028674.1 unnamed protein product [Aureobasidium pullulans]
MGDRPTSAQEILKTYDKILHQVTNPQDLTQGKSPADQQQPMAETPSKTPKISKSVKTTPKPNIASPFSLVRPKKSAQSTHTASHDPDSCQQPDHLSHAARKPDIMPFSPVHPESQPVRKPIYVPFDNDYDIEQSDDDEKNQQRSQSPEETPSKKQRTK